MLQYNLTNTQFMHDEPIPVPREGEFMAILVALLAIEGKSISDLQRQAVSLHEDRCDDVVHWITDNIPAFAREFGQVGVRIRLRQFIGLEVSLEQGCVRGQGFAT